MDMVVFPVLWSLLQTTTGTQITQWNPLTLQGAGLFHIAMGAVLGIAAFGRTQEKLGGANNGGLQSMAPSSPTTFSQPAAGSFGTPSTNSNSGFGAPAFNSGAPRQSTGFGAPAAAAAGATGGFAVASAMPMVGKPANIGPVDSDFMAPRDD